MSKHFRILALAVSLAAAGAAHAQQARSSGPLARTPENSFFYDALRGANPLDANANAGAGIARPKNPYTAVTPVPEPSEWLMMVAGLGIVGFIARRSSRRR